jgi:hypothetical protein
MSFSKYPPYSREKGRKCRARLVTCTGIEQIKAKNRFTMNGMNRKSLEIEVFLNV